MLSDRSARIRACRARQAFTIVEVVLAIAIVSLVLAGTLTGYIMAVQRAEWSGYSLAAQSLALQRLEQARGCKWDIQATPTVDQLVSTNFPVQTNALDILNMANAAVIATNFTTIQNILTNPPLRFVQVDCVWRFRPGGRLFTNTVATYRSPDS